MEDGALWLIELLRMKGVEERIIKKLEENANEAVCPDGNRS